MSNILIIYYSSKGSCKQLASLIARGVESANSANATICTVPRVSAVCEQTEPEIPEDGHRFVSADDLQNCDGIILGSPARFGNMAASLKYFLESTTSEWLNGTLVNKPCGVFTSAATMHGGQESCLLSMALPLIHHGMVFVGLPYSEPALSSTTTGGTPYGVSHFAGAASDLAISEDEKALCLAYGKRIANIANKLKT